MTEPGGRHWLRWLERTAGLAVAGFLAWYLITNWRRVAEYDWTVDWPRLLASAALLALAYSGYVGLWRHVLARMGSALSMVDAHRVWYLANMGRYVPGKVVQTVGLAYMVRAKGGSPVAAIASAAVAQTFVVATGGAVAALALPETANGGRGLYVAGAAFAAAVLVVLLTPAFDALLRLALRLARRPELYVPVPWTERAGLAAGYFTLTVVTGLAFWLFLTSVAPVEADAVWALIGVYAAGYVAGWLAFFVPGGLGVREGVYALLLALYIPPTAAVAAAVLARIWSTAVEVVVVAILLALYGAADLRASTVPSTGHAHG